MEIYEDIGAYTEPHGSRHSASKRPACACMYAVASRLEVTSTEPSEAVYLVRVRDRDRDRDMVRG